MKSITQVPFRNDNYGTRFYVVKDKKESSYSIDEKVKIEGLNVKLSKTLQDDILSFTIDIEVAEDLDFDACGLRLGVDSYMDKYPAWDNKFFPTALRCEKNGFWGCFCSPKGDMLGVCSPSKIVSWKNEYNKIWDDVGHRIYTSSIEFLNTAKQPERHPVKTRFAKGEKLHYVVFLTCVDSKNSLYEFVKKYSNIVVPTVEKITIEDSESELGYGRHIISHDKEAETSVYVRHDWIYYLDCARKNAEKCKQKVGTHTESWYGFFSMVAYAKIVKELSYTSRVISTFDNFFEHLTKFGLNKKVKMKRKALPYRLQNVSCMLSLLADMYELSLDKKYLNYANDFAEFLMKLQAKDGSYRSYGTHYTCVIYPAKSMLELALVEKEAGYEDRYKLHFNSAYMAIVDLYNKLDNIGTEGEMTFEDGMISCESLQLGYLATLLKGEEREKLTKAAKYILEKHMCLEQKFIPDSRTYGATLRFWEARYDLNYFQNMMNTPHGWTSWKNYATYYLYILTGEKKYLIDLMNTLGACMQVVDAGGELNWAFVMDPCVTGQKMVRDETKELGFRFDKITVGEEYLGMISDWYYNDDKRLVNQYIRCLKLPQTWKKDFGGSCDNDVHEHFKCLDETVFGKAFIHIENQKALLYNCVKNNVSYSTGDKNSVSYSTGDKYVHTFVVYADNATKISIVNKEYNVEVGFNYFNV